MPRSLALYIAASSVYAALVFLAVHATYGIELGRSGVRLPDPTALLSSIDTVSFAIWVGLSLIAATLLYGLAQALEGARDEGQQRQGEIASIFALGQALSGSLELDDIAERFVATARGSLDPSVTAALYISDDAVEGFRLVREGGPHIERLGAPSYSATTLPAPIRTRVVDHQGSLVVTDAMANPAWPPLAAGLRDPAWVRSFAAIPLVSHDRLVGLAMFASDRVGSITPDSLQIVALGTQFVASAVRELRGAMEAARLFQSRQHENERLLALQRASAVVAARSTTREVIDEIMRTASSLLGQASASLYLWDAAEGGLRLAQNADPSGRRVGIFLSRGTGGLGDLLAKLEPVVVNDYPTWSAATPNGIANGLQAVLGVPLVRTGTLLGAVVLRAYDARARFTLDDARLLSLFGDQAVSALTNAEAFERQRAAMEQLERVNRAKSEFVSIVSHEFRTPLTGIQGFSEMMKDEDLTIAEMKEYASDINKDAHRLNRMITEMLDLDRMEAGRMTIHPEATDLNAIISEAADRVRPNAPGHPITL